MKGCRVPRVWGAVKSKFARLGNFAWDSPHPHAGGAGGRGKHDSEECPQAMVMGYTRGLFAKTEAAK